jgi:type IV pilus assembly protein PilM
MFNNDLVAVELGHEHIKILVGSRKKVKYCGAIKTPEEAFVNDNIVNSHKLSRAILAFLEENNIKTKRVSFTVHGQDIVVRHMETPIMDTRDIIKSLQWELSQYLPEEGKDYYNDYEIVDKINTPDKKAYKVMVASISKEKVDKYVGLSKKLKMKLSAIDIAPNNISRVFRNAHKLKTGMESVGIMNIGLYSSNFTILSSGNLFIQRDIPFGIKNVSDVVFPYSADKPEESIKNFLRVFSFISENEDNSVNDSVKFIFREAFYNFDKLIQFYTTGRINKFLDMIYIIGEGAEIKGIDSYVQAYFSTNAEIVESAKEIGIKTVLPKDFRFRYYINNLGLLFRKE